MTSYKKYKDDIVEDYLDDEKQYYDYGTATYTGGKDVFDLKHTGMSFYDQFLGTSELAYLRDKKNLKGTVVEMSPAEYYDICAHKIFNTTVEKLRRERGELDRKIIDKLKNVLNVYKKKLCPPMINYADRGQEGLHRMLAVAELFSWNEKFPVLVVEYADPERAEREKQAAKKQNIDYKVQRAVKNTLQYYYFDNDDLSSQLQAELYRQFQYVDDIDVPDEIPLKETEESLIFTFAEYEYPIDKEDIQWKARSEEDDLEIDDLDLDDEDFLVRYFGKDWRTTHPHLKDIYNIKEAVETAEIDRNIVEEVLEAHNHCYYQDSSMACELICEKLFYEHKIDARYKGRTIYVGEKKIATIKVERETWDRLGMYGYTLFI